MKVAIAVCLCLAVSTVNAGLIAAPGVVIRTPSLDSAVIRSDRLGGNFAYSTAESHAYAHVSPVVQHVVSPVAVSYTAHQVPLAGAYHGGYLGHHGVPLAYPGLTLAQPGLILGHPGGLLVNPSVIDAAPAADAPAAPAAEAAPEAPSASDDAVSVESA